MVLILPDFNLFTLLFIVCFWTCWQGPVCQHTVLQLFSLWFRVLPSLDLLDSLLISNTQMFPSSHFHGSNCSFLRFTTFVVFNCPLKENSFSVLLLTLSFQKYSISLVYLVLFVGFKLTKLLPTYVSYSWFHYF